MLQNNQIKIGKKVYTVKKEHVHLLNHYFYNEKAKVGGEIQCISCETKFIKKLPNHKFCGDLQCKDAFWNKIDCRKRNRNGKNGSSLSTKEIEINKRLSNNSSDKESYINEYEWNDWSSQDYHNKD